MQISSLKIRLEVSELRISRRIFGQGIECGLSEPLRTVRFFYS